MTDLRTTADPTVREIPLAPGGEIELRLGSNRLRVRVVDGDRVVVRGRTDHDLERDVEITSGVGWVRVTDGPAGSFRLGPITVRSGGHAPDLDVEVPRNVRISARTMSGDIEAVGIAAPSRWYSTSGTVRIATDGGPLSIETISGDTSVEATAPIALTCRTVSGAVKVRAPRIQALDVATTSGDVTVDAALDEGASHAVTSVSGDVRLITGSEVTVAFQSVAGDIRAAVPHRVDGSRGRRTVVVGSGRVQVGVKTMSGDMKLKPGSPDGGAPADPTGGPNVAPSASTWGAGMAAGTAWAVSAASGAWGAATEVGRPFAPEPPQAPVAPEPPVAPAVPVAPAPPEGSSANETSPVPVVTPADIDAARLEVLRSLERGELDVETAAERLAALEGVAGQGAG